jgi:hypothetical protein
VIEISFEGSRGKGFSAAFALKSSKVLSQSFYTVIGFLNKEPTCILVIWTIRMRTGFGRKRHLSEAVAKD